MRRSKVLHLVWPLTAAAGGACEIQTIQPVDWLGVQRELTRLEQEGQHALPSDATVRGS